MNAIVSVNVGLPRDVKWRGKTARTAIWKEPVNGRVLATRLNLIGDAQADLSGHGGEQRAIMVYQLASYRHWENCLRRSDFVYGNFGENFTVEVLADDEVCIGAFALRSSLHPEVLRSAIRRDKINKTGKICSPRSARLVRRSPAQFSVPA
jgi:MOSC domain-containing protein YiiM